MKRVKLKQSFLDKIAEYEYLYSLYKFTGSSDKPIKIDLEKGYSAIECFYMLETHGSKVPTKEPERLINLLRAKAAINMQIKMWAEGRADATLPRIEFEEYAKEMKLPDWIIEAVEHQKIKILLNKNEI